ncbi:hypothetical protein D0865_03218 [Hortaea werneckii]|uniref:Uncharacterized protein n=1 Tax=Hortaea werneckii TaxID=91943 RepID=A0A3M7CYM2_HORWE|nr:hypothetical protein D0865_03218 [Hortaea werneckii]
MAFGYEEDPKNLHKAVNAAKAISQRTLVSANRATTQSKIIAKTRPKTKSKIPLDTAHDTKQAWIGKISEALSPNPLIWMNAFIPLHFVDVTKPWPKHPGKTMIEGLATFLPVFGGCFLGDQRGFSSDNKATARMHSRAWVQSGPDMGSKGYKMQQQHFCSPTTKVDCDDDSVKDEGTAGIEGMKFTEVAGGSANRVSLKLKAGAGNPLVPGAPKIDYEGVLTIDRVKKFVEFSGKVDDFPSFEAYVMIDGKGTYKIKQLGPAPGSGPTSLATWNGVDRPFSGRVSF